MEETYKLVAVSEQIIPILTFYISAINGIVAQ